MKKSGLFAIMVCCILPAMALQTDPAQTNLKVEQMLAKMTLEEKVGQMTELTLDAVIKTDDKKVTLKPHTLDEQKLNEALLKYHVGSILNTSGKPNTREEWHTFISKIQQTAAKDRLKIPVIYGIDAIHGMNYTLGCTLFPQEIAMAATFNTALVHKAAEITAYETRASYIPWNYSPVLDLGKNALWPRIYETFGEDPFVVKTMGAAMIKG
ncbi:MAG: beta-glucosidase, partial [Sphingobacteriales bacterium]